MIDGRAFETHPDFYARNVADGRTLCARPATLANGARQEPGVAIFASGRLLAVVPERDALRLAHEIADASDWHRGVSG